jgi:hypothetical protein
MKTTIRLSGPADVLTVLPYQLGFHPDNCLVVVCLRGSRMGLVQRIDLPPPGHVGDAVDAMLAPLQQERPGSVLLIGFEERDGQSRAMLDEMDDACRDHGFKVDDRMVVRDGRWYDLDCSLSCCPPEGLPLPAPSEVPAVAEFVGREICPLPDRAALANLLEPNRPLVSRTVTRLADEWLQLRLEATDPGQAGPSTGEYGAGTAVAVHPCSDSELHGFRANELAVWSRVLGDEDDAAPVDALPPQDLAMLAVSLTDVDLRDGLIAWLCPGALSPDLMDPDLFAQMAWALPEPWRIGDPGAVRDPGGVGDAGGREEVISRQRIERQLCELCAALPDVWAAPALTVLASFTWWRGDGALTRIALDRALRIDPLYRLAQLLERMVDLAIRPEQASA